MRILVIHEYNLPYGGGEQYLHDTCEALRKLGHRVSLVCAEDRNQGFLPVDTCHGIKRSVGFRTGRQVLTSVEDIFHRERPDLVFLNGIGRLFMSPVVLHRVVRSWPTVLFVHHMDLICPTGRKVIPSNDRLCEWAQGISCFRKGCVRSIEGSLFDRPRGVLINLWRMRVLRRCGLVIVPSQYVRRECIRNGFPPRQLRVLPCFTTKGRRPIKNATGSQILWVGRGEAGKGLDQFLRSLALLRDRVWRAVVVGDGPDLDRAVNQAAELGLRDRVTFVGRLVGEELDVYYASSRLLVFTPSWMETFGQVGIETMAFGRPVVASDVGGPSEWLVDGLTGFMVPRGDYAGMADRIAWLLEDDPLWCRMSKAARERVEEQFRLEHHLPRLVQVFEEAIGMHQSVAVNSANDA